MKTSIYLAAIAASGALAKPHGHHHRRSLHSHHAKRAVTEETTVVTVTVCKLGALELPESICDYYVNKGVLRYVDGGSIELASSAAPVVSLSPKIYGNSQLTNFFPCSLRQYLHLLPKSQQQHRRQQSHLHPKLKILPHHQNRLLWTHL